MEKVTEQMDYQFTNQWFNISSDIWDLFLEQEKPKKILEVGSFEGQSACYLINKIAAHQDIELHCVDTWEGGIEHKAGQENMSNVEIRFKHNTNLALQKSKHKVSLTIHKGFSDHQMIKLLSQDKVGYFDFIYIDGSHQADDVLLDALLGFKLLKVGGYMFFDDYNWRDGYAITDPLRSPKIAIDAFTTIFSRKVIIKPARIYQLYVQKISD